MSQLLGFMIATASHGRLSCLWGLNISVLWMLEFSAFTTVLSFCLLKVLFCLFSRAPGICVVMKSALWPCKVSIDTNKRVFHQKLGNPSIWNIWQGLSYLDVQICSSMKLLSDEPWIKRNLLRNPVYQDASIQIYPARRSGFWSVTRVSISFYSFPNSFHFPPAIQTWLQRSRRILEQMTHSQLLLFAF